MGNPIWVGVVQGAAVPGGIEENIATLRRLVAEAADLGARVVVTPELFATGYSPASAWQWDGVEIRGRLAALAREHGVALVGSTIDSPGGAQGDSSARQDQADRPIRHIAASFFDPHGEELVRVNKRHLFGAEEKAFITPGKGYAQPFEWEGWRWGMGICYDVEFPEFARSQAVSGAQVLLVPTAVPELEYRMTGRAGAWGYSATSTSTLQVPARALENGVFIAYSNHCGPGFTGHSCLATPFGRNAALLPGGDSVAVMEVDSAAIECARELNVYLNDL
ncbi:nitrilase-related carbon-nitrogen hydrolase [Arthrobacter sp. C9C5]|uniref:nitrilase-related carbon-nitrogen hydrolase n=1 Tax=Arthrobacter sp. C9C5 TaxID=2735267 RepID=UPI001584764D|nr:nitrilase-related carbon-nitrogen hydrolase [Arthrobacter sp. C9C5]NUU32950.1 carbon-nitrogen hydrolase [Arthrobacter sp. C9C5]